MPPKRLLLDVENFKRYIYLPDGRKITYAESGPKGGKPILMMHGQANSRLNLLNFYGNERRAEDLGLRIICPDRPGRGLSTFHRQHSFATFAQDMEFLVNELEIIEFTLLGYNTGATYALKLAEYFGGRVDRLFLFSPWLPPLLPGNKGLRRLLSGQKWFLRMNVNSLHKGAENPGMALRMLLKWASKEEKSHMRQERIMEYYGADMEEGFAQGASAAMQEYLLLKEISGFDASKLTLPTQVFDGELDRAALPAIVEPLIASLPNADYKRLPGSGHFFFYYLSDQILEMLA